MQLHLLPKSALDVHLLILESDTVHNVLSAGLTVASAAIADAGIPMFALGVGSTVGKQGDKMLVDPEAVEGDLSATLALGVLPALGKVSGVWMTGEVGVEEVLQVSCHLARNIEELSLDDSASNDELGINARRAGSGFDRRGGGARFGSIGMALESTQLTLCRRMQRSSGIFARLASSISSPVRHVHMLLSLADTTCRRSATECTGTRAEAGQCQCVRLPTSTTLPSRTGRIES